MSFLKAYFEMNKSLAINFFIFILDIFFYTRVNNDDEGNLYKGIHYLVVRDAIRIFDIFILRMVGGGHHNCLWYIMLMPGR